MTPPEVPSKFVKVSDTRAFLDYVKKVGMPPTGLAANRGYFTTGRILHDPADDVFLEADYFHKYVEYQSRLLAAFINDVSRGFPGIINTISDVSLRYQKADLDGHRILTKQLTNKQSKQENTNAAQINAPSPNDLNHVHDAHGYDGGGTDSHDEYMNSPLMGGVTPPQLKRTEWPSGKSGELFDRVHEVFRKMEPQHVSDIGERWQEVGADLRTAGNKVSNATRDTLGTGVWMGAAGDRFRQRIDESTLSISTWAESTAARGTHLRQTAAIVRLSKWTIDSLYTARERELLVLEGKEAARPRVATGKVPDLSFSMARDEILRRYDGYAEEVATGLGNSLVARATNWTAPAMYPGLVTDGGIKAVPDMTTGNQTGVPTGGPTGTPTGGPTGTPTGGPTGTPTGAPTGGPNPQSVLDKQRKQYEDALKEQQDTINKLRKQYEEQLRQQQQDAQKQVDDLNNQLKQQQEQTQQEYQNQLQQQQDEYQQQRQDLQQQTQDAQQDAQRSIDDLTRQLQDSLNKMPSADLGGLDALAALPPSVGAALTGLPALLSGGGGIGGLGGSSISTGLPAATGGIDLMGRTGVAGPLTTGVGTSALTGRVPAGAGAGGGMGGMPFMPGGMMGGAPGGNGGALSGRKSRPILPEDKPQPTSRPRIVDPDGDGTTEAHPVREGERRARVTRPAKAPEVEPGQALGRTA